MSEAREYVDDDYCPEREPKKRLVMNVAAGDYFLATADDGLLVDGEVEFAAQLGPWVRIRTSGSSDPRNLRVCRALRELWEALREKPNG